MLGDFRQEGVVEGGDIKRNTADDGTAAARRSKEVVTPRWWWWWRSGGRRSGLSSADHRGVRSGGDAHHGVLLQRAAGRRAQKRPEPTTVECAVVEMPTVECCCSSEKTHAAFGFFLPWCWRCLRDYVYIESARRGEHSTVVIVGGRFRGGGSAHRGVPLRQEIDW